MERTTTGAEAKVRRTRRDQEGDSASLGGVIIILLLIAAAVSDKRVRCRNMAG